MRGNLDRQKRFFHCLMITLFVTACSPLPPSDCAFCKTRDPSSRLVQTSEASLLLVQTEEVRDKIEDCKKFPDCRKDVPQSNSFFVFSADKQEEMYFTELANREDESLLKEQSQPDAPLYYEDYVSSYENRAGYDETTTDQESSNQTREKHLLNRLTKKHGNDKPSVLTARKKILEKLQILSSSSLEDKEGSSKTQTEGRLYERNNGEGSIQTR